MSLSTAQLNALNGGNPRAKALGVGIGDLIADLMLQIASSNLAITSDAADVDSIAKGGGAFSVDADNCIGLTFAWQAGRWTTGKSIVTVAAGTIALSASATNYIEADRSGAVSKNTAGFTAGRVQLFVVTTGASSFNIDSGVVSAKTLLYAPPNGGISGDLLSAAGGTKSILQQLGTISATASFLVIAPNTAAAMARLALTVSTAITADDANYWTIAVTNKTASGSGTTAMLAASDANTTKATGGSGISAYIARAMTLNGTTANLNTAANDVLVVTFTKTGSAANLVGVCLQTDFTFAG